VENTDSEIKKSNCLFGVIKLAMKYREGELVVMVGNDIVPHLLWLVEEKVYHFRLVRDFLPMPFGLFLFKGKYDVMDKSKLFCLRKTSFLGLDYYVCQR